MRVGELEKVALVADWEPAMRTLRPCFDAFRGGLACGRCEKCLRTMAALESIGKLKGCPVFSADGLTPDMLRGLQASPPTDLPADRGELLRQYSYYAFNDSSSHFWRQLVEPLRRCGRDDLAEVVEEKLAEYERWAAWLEDAGLSGTLRRLDRRYTGGRGYRLYQGVRGRR